jgi:hypothetical protein
LKDRRWERELEEGLLIVLVRCGVGDGEGYDERGELVERESD